MTCYALVYVIGLVLNDEKVSGLGLAAVSGMAGIVGLTKYQAGEGVVYWAMGVLAVFPFAIGWKRFTGQWTRRERRALAALFGEPTLGDMLFRDSRLKAWRQRK